mmetsp:Transcript_10085/g.13115  ORF Transcript_10085/g.13115 Transcript_10085/m.13115 type:complete len:204 (+) Transcript_10085:1140-1751(+)
MEESNDSTFKLSSTPGVDRGRRESLPNDSFTNVRCNEQTDSRSKPVSLLQKLVENQHNDTSKEQLGDNQESITSSNRTQVTIHSTHNVGDCLSYRDKDTKKLLRTVKQGTILLEIVIHLDNATTGKKLHDETRRDNGTDTKLHKRTTVGRKNNTHPIKRIGRFGRLNSIQRDLTAYEKDKKRNGSPEKLFTEWNLTIGLSYLR